MNVTVDAHWHQLSSRATVKSSSGYYTYSNSLSLLGGASQNVFQQAARSDRPRRLQFCRRRGTNLCFSFSSSLNSVPNLNNGMQCRSVAGLFSVWPWPGPLNQSVTEDEKKASRIATEN